ncbi:MAG: lysylphosphatidylglycerol synthase transmembrane domain-containing protein [Ferruginibacter sp.]
MNKSIKLIFNYLLAPVLFIILSWSLYYQIINQPDLPDRWQHVKTSWHQGAFWFVCFLMTVNWGLEAKKWQLLISPLEKFSFIKSFKSVLAGCSITMLTPNRIGEYGGRIIYVEEKNRLSAISVTILGSISQMTITMLMGSLGLIFLRIMPKNHQQVSTMPWLTGNILLYVSITFTVILLIFYFRIRWVLLVIGKAGLIKSFIRHLRFIEFFTNKQLLRILVLSYTRYIVFILQYVLLLNVMGVNVSMILCFWLLTIFYLVMAVAPTIGFIELPVRAAVSVELFRMYSINIIGIQAAALGIWIINLVIPAIIGSILIFGIKILKDR